MAKVTQPRAGTPRTTGSIADAGTWLNIIQIVKNPLAFYVLVVLVVESIIGTIAGLKSCNDTLPIIIVMAVIITLLIITVTFIAVFFPEIVGLPKKISPTVLSNAEIIKNPRLLLVDSEE